MRQAVSISAWGLGRVGNGRPSVGCVLVKDGLILAQARTGNGGAPHAEAAALKKAGRYAKGATAYITLEPCAHYGRTPPCAEALIDAGIARCVIACADPFSKVDGQGIQKLRDAGISAEVGLMAADAMAVNAGFFLNIKKREFKERRPFVTLKMAVSQDGKITDKAGQSAQITDMRSMARAHWERSYHDAILVGVGTVLADNPMLTTRINGLVHKGIRIILDSRLKTPLDSRLVQSARDVHLWVFGQDNGGNKAYDLRGAGVRVFDQSPIDLHAIMFLLAKEGITRLLIEGGAAVNTAFMRAGLYDRVLRFTGTPDFKGAGVDALHHMDVFDLEKLMTKRKSLILGQDVLDIFEQKA